MEAIIISIGDELLIGQVVNTNAAFIAEKLNGVGIEVKRILTIGDDEDAILQSIREAVEHADVVVATGGLGPTHDDVTRSAVCKFFHVDLVPSDEARKNVQRFLHQRNYPWTAAAENQTLIPWGARVIPNEHGTAPGELFERDGKYIIVMPGVPYEMESMVVNFVVPFFRQRTTDKVILHRTLRTTGIPESVLANRVGDIDAIVQGEKLAFLPSPTGVKLRISITGTDRAASEQKLREIESRIREKAEPYIYGTDTEELEEVLGRLLLERKLTIAIAESCTGGMIAHVLTNVSGSSRYVERAIVAYSNESKIRLLGVPRETIQQCGAVSEEVAVAMARGIRETSETDIGLSTTGIAGPTGGTPEKPVGLVWIGYSHAARSFAKKYNFGGARIHIKQRATQAAMDLVRRQLLRID